MTSCHCVIGRCLAISCEETKCSLMEDTPIFPDHPAVTVERTLAIIKPDAIHHAEEIVERIKAHGFTILAVSSRILVIIEQLQWNL